LIDLDEAVFQWRFECSEVCPNRRLEEREARVGEQVFLVSPPVVIDQVVCETPEANVIAAEDTARFQAVAQETLDQELIAVWEHMSLAIRALDLEIAFGGVGHEAEGLGVWRILTERPSFLQGMLQKRYSFDQRGVPG
jgi:hypothetical protein